jgi:hypothetical protein
MRTEQKRSFFPGEPLRLLPIVFISLFAVTAVADALIALQPSVLRPLRDSFQHWVAAGGATPSWASVFASGVAMAGIAIAASLLSVFVRGVQQAPYTWLAPIVVCAGAALMARLPVELPVPFSAPAFTLLGACAVLGGGAMLRRDAFAARFAAVLVMATPVLLLAIGYSQGGSTHTPQAATEFVFLLAMTTFTTAVLAWVTRETSFGDSGAGGQGEQLVELLERARTAEARATFAEQQLASAGYGSFAVQSPQTGDFEALANMRGGSSGHTLLWAAVLFLIGILATGYFAGYMPLQNRMEAQRQLAQTKDEQSAAALKSLRSSFDSERSELQAQLRAAKAAAVPAAVPVAPEPPQAPAAKESAPEAKKIETKRVEAKVETKQVETKKVQPAPAKVAESPAPAKAKVVATHTARPARIKKVSARTAAAKPAATKAGAPAAAAKSAHYDDDSLDDDPIGGL